MMENPKKKNDFLQFVTAMNMHNLFEKIWNLIQLYTIKRDHKL